MKKNLSTFKLFFSAFLICVFLCSFASSDSSPCGDQSWYIVGSKFWGKKVTSGCDFIDDNGDLHHVECTTYFVLWIGVSNKCDDIIIR